MITTGQDQISRAIEHQPEENDYQINPNDPIMPFPTSYRLTAEQEKEIVDWAMTKKEELEREMGRDVCGAGGTFINGAAGMATPDPLGINGPQNTWMGKRVLFDKTFRNEMEWRPGVLGGIFQKSNLCLTVARDITRKMIARGISYFFGTSPWFAATPVGVMDVDQADKSNRYLRHKMTQAGLQSVNESAIKRAFVIGEAVVKTDWAQREQIYETTATVLVDANGQDILDANGDYITPKDQWIQDSAPDPVTGEEVMAELIVLKKDGITPQPEQMIWEEKLITRRIVHYKGPEAKLIHYLDFLCGLTEESIQKADCVAHLYDMRLMDLADQWKKSAANNATPEERVAATMKATQVLRLLHVGNGPAESAQNSDAVDASSKQADFGSRTQPTLQIAEFHLTYDIDGRGLRDVILVVDTKSRVPIFYDYEANCTADGLRPFSVIRPVEVDGRWYGAGAMELMNASQEILDLWFNRKNMAVSQSGRVDFWRPHNTEEGKANPHLRMNWGGSYTPIGDKKAAECLESAYLEDTIGDKLMELMEFVMQIMMNGSGVASANDGNVSGMDSTKLATGIRNVEKSGQELFAVFISCLEPGVTDVLQKMCKITYVNLDRMEVFRYFEEGEGGEGAGNLIEIDPADIANLEMDVEILLSKRHGEQVLESNVRVLELIDKFYAYAYEVQINVRQNFVQMAKELQIKNAEKLFVPTMPQPPMAGPLDAAGISAAGANPPKQSAPNL